MGTALFIGLVLVVAAVPALAFFAERQRDQPERKRATAYRSKRVLTNPEQVAFLRLREALLEHEVLAQVSFSRFLHTRSGDYAAFNVISRKTADFVICRRDFSVVAVIELDDSSHNADRDAKRDELLASAGISTIRWNVNSIPSIDEIRADEERALAEALTMEQEHK